MPLRKLIKAGLICPQCGEWVGIIRHRYDKSGNILCYSCNKVVRRLRWGRLDALLPLPLAAWLFAITIKLLQRMTGRDVLSPLLFLLPLAISGFAYIYVHWLLAINWLSSEP